MAAVFDVSFDRPESLLQVSNLDYRLKFGNAFVDQNFKYTKNVLFVKVR